MDPVVGLGRISVDQEIWVSVFYLKSLVTTHYKTYIHCDPIPLDLLESPLASVLILKTNELSKCNQILGSTFIGLWVPFMDHSS